MRDYCAAALGRFVRGPQETAKSVTDPTNSSHYYRVTRLSILWDGVHDARNQRSRSSEYELRPLNYIKTQADVPLMNRTAGNENREVTTADDNGWQARFCPLTIISTQFMARPQRLLAHTY